MNYVIYDTKYPTLIDLGETLYPHIMILPITKNLTFEQNQYII